MNRNNNIDRNQMRLEYVNCCFCGADDTNPLLKVKERMFGKEKFNIVQCKKCGMIYTNPRPQEDAAEKYYPYEYSPFQFVYPDKLFPQEKSKLRKLKNWIKQKVLNLHYGYFGKSNKPGIMKAITLPLKYSVGWIFPPYIKKGKVLDIGCSTGVYLTKLKELGWDCYGIEINKASADWAKNKLGLKVSIGTANMIPFPAEFFNAVSMWHTLEHVYSPENAIREVFRVLKNGGVFIIGIPNAGSVERKFFGRWWWAWEVPRHLCHFSPKTITLLLSKNKFKDIKIEYLPDVRNIILSLQNFLLDFLPSKRNWIKVFFDPDKNPRLRMILKIIGYVLSSLRQAGRIIVYAKK